MQCGSQSLWRAHQGTVVKIPSIQGQGGYLVLDALDYGVEGQGKTQRIQASLRLLRSLDFQMVLSITMLHAWFLLLHILVSPYMYDALCRTAAYSLNSLSTALLPFVLLSQKHGAGSLFLSSVLKLLSGSALWLICRLSVSVEIIRGLSANLAFLCMAVSE